MYCEKCGSSLIDGKCPNCEKKEPTKKRVKNRNMAIFAVVLSVLSVGLLVGGFFVLSSSRTIMLQSISNWSGRLKKSFTGEDDTIIKKILSHDQVRLDETLSLTVDPKLDLGFEKASIKLGYNDDQKAKKSSFDLQMLLDENEFSLDGFLSNNKLYLKVKDVFDKYYYLDTEYISFFKDIEKDDSEKFIDIVFDSLKESVEEKDFKKSKETIYLGDNTKKTTKISYSVTSKKLYEILVSILKKISNDKDLIGSMSEANDLSEEEMKNQLVQMIRVLEAESEKTDELLFDYNVYYYGFNNIVMEEITVGDIAIQYYHYDKTEELKIVDIPSKTNYFTMKAVEEKESTTISGFIYTYGYQGTLKETDDTFSMKITFDFEEEGKLVIESTGENKDQENMYQSKIDFKISGNIEDIDLGDGIQLSMLIQYTFDQKIDITDLKDTTSFEDMTEEEQLQILEALENHPLISPIIDFFMVYVDDYDDMDGDYYDDNYDWDLDDSSI